LLKLAACGPDPIPPAIGLDWRVLGFTACVTLMTVILFGLAPALRATRVELATTLRAQARGLTGGLIGSPGRFSIGKMLVALQVALSLTLLVGTSLLVRSTNRLESLDLGLARETSSSRSMRRQPNSMPSSSTRSRAVCSSACGSCPA
jgi:hypothetical protein